MRENELTKFIDEALDGYIDIPCLHNPNRTCTKQCPIYYDAAGAIILQALRHTLTPQKYVENLRLKTENLNSKQLGDFRNILESAGITIDLCINR